MSVESRYKPVSYTGTGGTSVFPFGWVCYEKSWIHVSADGLELTQGTDYTVALESTSGGSVTLSAPLAAGKVLIIWMEVPITQENRYPNTGQLNTVTIEKALDKQTLIAQQQQDAIERSVKVPVGSQEKPEDVVQNIYNARDAAAASATAASAQATAAEGSAQAAANSATTAAQTVEIATADAVNAATAQANNAHDSALAAAQSAAEAEAAVPDNLVARVTDVEGVAASAKAVTDLATETPGAGKIPKAGTNGKIDPRWYGTPSRLFASFNTSEPDGLLANGGAYSRTTYAALFAILGTSFGAGDGSTTFNVPDFRGRTIQGASANLKAVLAAGLPNVKGEISLFAVGSSNFAPLTDTAQLTAPFYKGAWAASSPGGTNTAGRGLGIDLSLSSAVFKDGITTVQSPAIAANIFIKY